MRTLRMMFMVLLVVMAGSGIARAERTVISETLMDSSTSGDRNGGQFLPNQGWKASGSTSYIRYNLDAPITCGGYMEVEVTNFKPSNQIAPYTAENPEAGEARFLVGYGAGASSPTEAEINQSGWAGIKAFSWTDTHAGQALGVDVSAQGFCGHNQKYTPWNPWNEFHKYKFRIEWSIDTAMITAWKWSNESWDEMFSTITTQYMYGCAYPIDTIFLGRDGANSGLAGPIYSNIKVVDYEDCGAGPCVCTGEEGSCSCVQGEWPDGDVDTVDEDSEYDVDIDFVTESFALAPLADSYAYGRTQNQGDNYGTRIFMNVSGQNNDFYTISYLKFEIPDEGLELIGATLHLNNIMTSPGYGGEVYSSGNNWEELTLSWFNKPDATGDMLADLGTVAPSGWAEADVSGAITGPGTYSFRIQSTSGESVSYATKEYSETTLHPWLEVFFKPPPGTGDEAVEVSNTFPARMVAGSYTQATCTLRNTGITHWTLIDYQLGAVGDSDPFASPRQYIQQEGGVPPGEEYTFNILMHAPESPSRYVTQWQMYHRDVHFFGDMCSAEVEVIEAQGTEDYLKRHPSNPRQMQYLQSTYYPRSIAADSLLAYPEADILNFISSAKQRGFNMIRMKLLWIKPDSGPMASAPGSVWPFGGTPEAPAMSQLSETLFEKLQNVLQAMHDNEMTAGLVLFDCGLDYSQGFTNNMKAYVDYVVTTLRNEPNLYYELADEYNNPCFAGGLSDNFLNQVVNRIRSNDNDHLLTVSGQESLTPVYQQSSWNQLLLFHLPDAPQWWKQSQTVFNNYSSVLKPKMADWGSGSATDAEITEFYQSTHHKFYSDPQMFARGLWIATLAGGSYTFTSHRAMLGQMAEINDMPGSQAFLVQKNLFESFMPNDSIVNPSPNRVTDVGDGEYYEALYSTTYIMYLVRGVSSSTISINYPSGNYGLYWHDPLTGEEVSRELRTLSHGDQVSVPDGTGDLILVIIQEDPPEPEVTDGDVDPDIEEELEPEVDETVIIDGDEEEAEPEEEMEPEPEPEPEPEAELEEVADEESEQVEPDGDDDEIAEVDSWDPDTACYPSGAVRCSNLGFVERCASSGSWEVVDECEYGCNPATVECKGAPPSNKDDGGCNSSRGAVDFAVLMLLMFGAVIWRRRSVGVVE